MYINEYTGIRTYVTCGGDETEQAMPNQGTAHASVTVAHPLADRHPVPDCVLWYRSTKAAVSTLSSCDAAKCRHRHKHAASAAATVVAASGGMQAVGNRASTGGRVTPVLPKPMVTQRAVVWATAVAIVGFWFATPPPSLTPEELLPNAPTAMRAIVYRSHGKAGDAATVVPDHPLPRVRDGDVIVRVFAAGLNPIDCKIMDGRMSMLEGLLFARPPAQIGKKRGVL